MKFNVAIVLDFDFKVSKNWLGVKGELKGHREALCSQRTYRFRLEVKGTNVMLVGGKGIVLLTSL
jgi:hypothetical protein